MGSRYRPRVVRWQSQRASRPSRPSEKPASRKSAKASAEVAVEYLDDEERDDEEPQQRQEVGCCAELAEDRHVRPSYFIRAAGRASGCRKSGLHLD